MACGAHCVMGVMKKKKESERRREKEIGLASCVRK
jgi:hypothetical protein